MPDSSAHPMPTELIMCFLSFNLLRQAIPLIQSFEGRVSFSLSLCSGGRTQDWPTVLSVHLAHTGTALRCQIPVTLISFLLPVLLFSNISRKKCFKICLKITSRITIQNSRFLPKLLFLLRQLAVCLWENYFTCS